MHFPLRRFDLLGHRPAGVIAHREPESGRFSSADLQNGRYGVIGAQRRLGERMGVLDDLGDPARGASCP